MSALPKKQHNSIVVIAAHPDDEVLGCGATIAKHSANGDKVHVLILGEGMTSRPSKEKKDVITLRQSAQKANDLLGVTSLTLHSFPDNRMDSLPLLEIVNVVESFIEKYSPSIIYTHFKDDLNVDHRLTHQAVVTACRPQPNFFLMDTLLFFEVPSSTEWQVPTSFQPHWFIDISKTIDKKLHALTYYETEMRSWPHARSIKAIEHLARWRGATVGVEAAEAFILGRRIEHDE